MPRSGNFDVSLIKGVWHVNISASLSSTGKRRRVPYPSRRKAEAAARVLRSKVKEEGDWAMQMPVEQRVDAGRAFKVLEGHGVGASLEEAARFFVDHCGAVKASVTLDELIDRYLADPQHTFGEEHAGKYETMRKRYSPVFGGRTVEEVTVEELVAALPGDAAPGTWNGHCRHLSALFRYGRVRGLCRKNPMELIARKKAHAPRRAILSVDGATKLMLAAEATGGADLAAWYAICLFAGLRPVKEATLTLWSDIDLDEGHIFVRGNVAKGGRERYAEISPNLKQWLLRYRGGGRRVMGCAYKEFRERRDAVREDAGVEWDNDIMRHSFCSYWMAAHGDSDRLCGIAGHSVQVSMAHYRRAVPKKLAPKFWGVLPEL